MIGAIVPCTTTVWAVFAGPKGEVRFARVQAWVVVDIVRQEGNQMLLASRQVNGIAIRDGQLVPCGGANILDFVGYDETRAAFKNVQPGIVTPDAAPWAARCKERRQKIEEERAKAAESKIVIPGAVGSPVPDWSSTKDLKALRSGENPLD